MTKDELALKDKKERGGRKKEKVKPPTKVIIRHLPPTMNEEDFLKQIDPLPDHDFYYFSAADWSLGLDATCRAYITLKNYDDVFLFRDRFDGYVFVDSKGSEYSAIVEFAPFQGLLKNKRRSDNKMNCIEEESHYQQFLAKLEEDREAAAKGGECKLEFTLDRKKDDKITSTPLLQYLANKKEKRREEAKKRTEEKRRLRDEEKEKRRQTSQQPQQVTRIMSGADLLRAGRKDEKSASGGGSVGKEHDKGDKGKNPLEERKNSRSKRRAERDQRRREEHEQRKRERERTERQEGDKGKKTAEEDGGPKASNAANQAQIKASESQSELKSEETKQRKDVKKYSEKRERDRDRQRNRKDKENEKEKEKEPKKESLAIATTVEEKTTPKQSVTEDEVSDSKNFIRSVKEFVPKYKQAQLSEEEEQPQQEGPTTTTSKPAESKEIKKKFDTENPNEEKTDGQKRSESSAARQLRKQRSAEERRIRNKDRPSIAIYTPKPRQRRVSEERDGKDGRSNPPSDCENYKKDDQPQQRTKKVSRYSERRRKNSDSVLRVCKLLGDQKPKSIDGEEVLGGGGDDNDIINEQRPRKSKSCDSGGSMELPTEVQTGVKHTEDNNEKNN